MSDDLTGFDDLAQQTDKDDPDAPDSENYPPLPQDPAYVPPSVEVDENGAPR